MCKFTQEKATLLYIYLGIKKNACQTKSEIECIQLFITDPIITMITKSTNIYIQGIQHLFDIIRDARFTDEREISSSIGIFFLIGILWSSSKKGCSALG